MNSDDFYKLWLAAVDMPNELKLYLKNTFADEKKIYNFYKGIAGYSGDYKHTNKITSVCDDEVYNLMENLERNSISFTVYKDPDYIKTLLESEVINPPYILFYKGQYNNFFKKRRISIVGTRRPTSLGIQITELITIELVKNDIATVSGGAYGIDTVAHKCTLEHDGSTCAVLGCGLNVIYPKTNRKLYHDITEKGVLISEFLPDTPPYAYNFPRRNRIISALGDSLIITEAADKSGSLITAGYSLELNKEIICVPGSPLLQNSKGCNMLIRDGASVLTEIEDLYTLLRISRNKGETTNYCGNKAIILNHIGKTPIHINELIEKCNIDINAIYGILFELQLEKEVISLNGNYFARIS